MKYKYLWKDKQGRKVLEWICKNWKKKIILQLPNGRYITKK